jgi:hypothetical protein
MQLMQAMRQLNNKLEVFAREVQTNKALHLVPVTANHEAARKVRLVELGLGPPSLKGNNPSPVPLKGNNVKGDNRKRAGRWVAKG